MSDLVAGAVVLFLIAGGGIVVLDAFVIRKIRQRAADRAEPSEAAETGDGQVGHFDR